MAVKEAELSSISKETLLKVDTRLAVAQKAKNLEKYSIPVGETLKDDQPILFSYVEIRGGATAKYRGGEAISGYMMGTALGYDIMTTHIASLSRKVDVAPLHIAPHDPFIMMALMMAVMGGANQAEQMLGRDWFDRSWISFNIERDRRVNSKENTPEFKKFVAQITKAPAYLSYFGHINAMFRTQERARQAIITGMFDQTMIYHYRLQDVDSPDKRYEISPDGTKKLNVSPSDWHYAQNPPQA